MLSSVQITICLNIQHQLVFNCQLNYQHVAKKVMRVKAAEDEGTLDAEIIYLHGKLINIILCARVVCVRVCMRFIKNLF